MTIANRADRPRVELSEFEHSIYFLIIFKQTKQLKRGSTTFWMDFVLKEDDVSDRKAKEINFNGASYLIARDVSEELVEYIFINLTTSECCGVDKDMHIRIMF